MIKTKSSRFVTPPKQVVLLCAADDGKFKRGERVYVIAASVKGGQHLGDTGNTSRTGELHYLIAKKANMVGGVCNVLATSVRFPSKR